MSSLSQGQTLNIRAKSKVSSRAVGRLTADVPITYAVTAAPGAVGVFIFTAPAPCTVVGIQEVHETAGGAASKLYVRKHVAGQTAAAAAAVSSTNIVDLVTGGIAADSTARAPQNATVVSAAIATPPVATNKLLTGDKLAILPPAAWIGTVTIWINWS